MGFPLKFLQDESRQALHLPGLSFPDRKRLFSAQLAAAVHLFPCHPVEGTPKGSTKGENHGKTIGKP